MFFFHITRGIVDGVAVSLAGYRKEPCFSYAFGMGGDCLNGWFSRQDLNDFDQAVIWAANASSALGIHFLAVDAGPNLSPRFDIVRAWEIGEAVNYHFNGDTYADGTISRILGCGTNQKIVVTSTGSRYYRQTVDGRKIGAGWKKTGGTWWLGRGHEETRNPHF